MQGLSQTQRSHLAHTMQSRNFQRPACRFSWSWRPVQSPQIKRSHAMPRTFLEGLRSSLFHVSHIKNPPDHRRVNQQVLAEHFRKILQLGRPSLNLRKRHPGEQGPLPICPHPKNNQFLCIFINTDEMVIRIHCQLFHVFNGGIGLPLRHAAYLCVADAWQTAPALAPRTLVIPLQVSVSVRSRASQSSPSSSEHIV